MARLGRTNLDVYKLGLGGIPLQKLSSAEAAAVIQASIEGGINFAETAEGYGDSEEKLSLALKGRRDSFVIATKSPKRSGVEMARAIDQSLARLQTDYIDIYQVHYPTTEESLRQVMAPGGALEALKAARASGKIRFIGISGHRPNLLVKALKTGEFDTVQVPINAGHCEARDELLPLAQAMDIGIIAMKPVAGGTLDTPSLGIRFCLDSAADVVLVGMKSVAEVRENLETARIFTPLDPDEQEQLLAEVSQWGDNFCRRCEYCQPCPHGVPIPKILWMSNFYKRDQGNDPWTVEEYASLKVTAAACEECGECEAKCPYELPIRDMLKEADRELRVSSGELAKRRIKKAVKKIIPLRRRPV
ncbi:MAG: aldo/keto reductase [Actinomycetota bacterium]